MFELQVASLPSKAAEAGAEFDAWQLLHFGDDALAWMTEHGRANPGQHLRFQYHPSQRHIECAVVAEGALPGRLRQELVGV